MQPRKMIVVGAGPVGALFALKLREQYPSFQNVEIHVFDKRETPGNRLEMLYILEKSFLQLPKDVQDYLLKPELNNGVPRCFFSPTTFNQMKDAKAAQPAAHVAIKIKDLEMGLSLQLNKTPGIFVHRDVEFIKNYQKNNAFIAEFKDLEHKKK